MEQYVNITDNALCTFIIYKIFNNPIIVYQSQLGTLMTVSKLNGHPV